MSSAIRPSVVVITGPTASGKSKFAVKLAQKLARAEIVNADSVQLYREFDIGSAKPTPEEFIVPHHLYSILKPDERIDVAKYCAMAHPVIAEILQRGNLPLVVGGSGLYIRALLCGLAKVDEVSQEIVKEVQTLTEPYRLLVECDPLMAARLHSADLQRVRRALAVKLSTGRSLLELQEEHRHQELRYRALVIALMPPRERLYAKIDRRVDEMLQQGLLDEVKGIIARHGTAIQGLTALGYAQVWQFLRGEVTQEEMLRLLKRDTRRFAKRQLTWWKNQPRKLGFIDVTASMKDFLDVADSDYALEIVNKFRLNSEPISADAGVYFVAFSRE